MKIRYAISQTTFSPSPTLVEASGSIPYSFLSLLPGDRLIVYSEDGGWCYGSIYGTKEEPGLFPTNAVSFLCKSETGLSPSEGNNVVDEINRVTQDWWYRIKELYGKRADLHCTNEILDYIDDLITTKQKILSGDVPAEELNLIRSQVGRKVDRGNSLLNLPVVIRQDNGVPYEADSVSLLQSFQEHLTTEKRVSENAKESEAIDNFTVLFSVHSIELKQTKYFCEVSFIVFDAQKKAFVTEPFSFLWKSDDVRTPNKDLNIRAFFSSFWTEEQSKRFYLFSRVALFSPIEGSSSTLKKSSDTGSAHLYCRQVYAYDLLDFSWILEPPKHAHERREKLLFLKRNFDFDHLFKAMHSNSKIPRETASSDDVKILISTQILKGTAEEIGQSQSYLYGRKPPVTISRCDQISFPKWNTLPRNEIYVTLQFGELGNKSSDRNIEARLSLVRQDGSVVEDAFETVSVLGPKRSREYKSFVFFHQDKPYWLELVKILLPFSASDDLYLKIAFYSRKPYDKGKAEKGPFALAHVCLLQNGSIVKNEEHEVLVYKIESSHGGYDDGCTAFMPLPQTRKQLRELGSTSNKPHSAHYSLSDKSVVHLVTQVCSNVYAMNDSIVNVLRWKTNSYSLDKSLQALASPVGDTDQEMLRFMHPLLESLFQLWEEWEQQELPVFNVIIAFLRLLGEPRNAESAVYFSHYIEKFHHVKAALKMMKCLHHYIESASKSNNDLARNSLKMVGGIFQIIVAAKIAMDKFDREMLKETEFGAHLDAVLEAIVKLMRENRERMTIQNVALKSLPQIIDPIFKCGVLDPNELCSWVVKVIGAFGPNIVARERLGFVGQIIETKLFEKKDYRARLLPKCLDLLRIYLDPDNCEQLREKEYPDRATECVTIISSLLDRLASQKKSPLVENGTEEELTMIISACYRSTIEAMVAVQKIHPPDIGTRRRHYFALILALLSKMSAQAFNQYLKSCVETTDKSDFIRETMEMIRDLLDGCPFPSTWEQMILLQNKTINKMLRYIMCTIQDNFYDSDHYAVIWEEYMLTAVAFVTQESLHRPKRWLLDDSDVCYQLRKSAAIDLRSMWFRLKVAQKIEYIPRLVGSFLKVALMEDAETRDATIPIFFDMMQCEFHWNDSKNFKNFATELVYELDHLINEGCGSLQFRKKFNQILSNQCQSEKGLWTDGGKQFISNVDHLIQYLFEYRTVLDQADCIENAMSRTVQLMLYYKKHNYTELYISYVYKLYALHVMYNNEIEAAKTLFLHAESLSWQDEPLPDWLITRALNSHCATERQLKEELVNRVVDHFSKGQMWEDALRILRDLQPVYENILVDYRQLAAAWDHMAELCRKIDAGNRSHPFYYFVAFYGRGYPSYLNGKKFVFRADDLERLGDFKTRMEQMYGNPESIPTMDDMSHLETAPGRYIQIFNVEPVAEHCPFDDSDDKINPNIKEYYRHYNIKNFEYSRTEIRKSTKWTEAEDSDIMRTWIVKRRVSLQSPLPSVLRFGQIVSSSKPYEISPLRRAVDLMKQKNTELLEMATYARHYPESSAQRLQGAILGVVQANVQGGIKNYEVFLLDENCMKIYENDEKNLASELSGAIIEQVEILEICLYAHAHLKDAIDKIHEYLVDSFYDHKKYVDNHFGRTSSRLPPGTSLKRISQPSQGALSDKSTPRHFSTSNFMDFAATSTGTLKSRGATFSTTVLNMLSPARKTPVSSPLHPLNMSRYEAGQTPSASDGNIRNMRLLSATSMDVRIRRSSKETPVPPPLPTRPPLHSNGSSSDGTIVLSHAKSYPHFE